MTFVRFEAEAQLAHAVRLLRENSSCPGCENGVEVWRPEGIDDEFWHGSGDDIAQCELPCIAEAVSLGLIEARRLPRCPKGHDWYGDGCEECQEVAAE